jgi:glycerophosphoryl diester phosphodiesterase
MLKKSDDTEKTSEKSRLKIVGHRGAAGLAPENTLAALRKALEHHVDEIEIDVRVTKDGIVILHHNRKLKDHSGAEFDIRKHTFKQLKVHKPDLTTLTEAIELIKRTVPLHIEVKRGEQTRPITTVVQEYLIKGWGAQDFLFGSKSQKTLVQLQRALPDIPLVVIESFSGVVATHRARKLNTKRISMNHLWLWSGFIRSMQHGGYELYAYTLNNPARAKRFLESGLAGVITDLPDLFEPNQHSQD